MMRVAIACLAGLFLIGCLTAMGQADPAVWRYTFEKPADGWMKPSFDDSPWKQGPGGFGQGNVHGSRIGTPWTTDEIWVRREVKVSGEVLKDPRLQIHHDEDAEVYVNGVLAAKTSGYTMGTVWLKLDAGAVAALKEGTNVLAVHCKQTRGGQYIDVDVVHASAQRAPKPAPKAGKGGEGKKPATPGRGPIAPLKTRWAKDVTPDNAWAEYPRPQMVRKEWRNLNGLWDYAIEGEGGEWHKGRIVNAEFDPLNTLKATSPGKWDGKILVPFCVESVLSGVQKTIRPNQVLWYRRTFDVPSGWAGQRIMLNFEAVDWHARVWVNGKQVGDHKGGYDPFRLDVTDALVVGKDGKHEVVLCVWDPTNMGDQCVGKQALPELRKGFRYTPTTGIWQTVWMEPVPRWRIAGLKLTPDLDHSRLIVELDGTQVSKSHGVDVVVLDGKKEVARGSGLMKIEVPIKNPRLWSPDDPFLYNVRITLRHYKDATKVDDEVTSYFGMRKISMGKDEAGFTRILLNNKPIFQIGPLDQGYWPDGILTPASDAAAAFDVEFLKRIACNMIRVHIKVHPARWYYHCDRLGLLVWQDMVCSRKFDKKISDVSAAQWEGEQKRMLDHLGNHPSVVMWVVFNEAWGQYDTERLTAWTKKLDPTRLVNNASGWDDREVGDVLDEHDYSFHGSVPLSEMAGGRAVLLGECGGFNRSIDGHNWYSQQTATEKIDYVGEPSRMTFGSAEKMADGYAYWVDHLWQTRHAHGLNAAVYTQITDVEHELNGWLTYDRERPKFDVEKIRELHLRLFRPAPKTRDIIPACRQMPVEWKVAIGKGGGEGWAAVDFDDSGWDVRKGPFGKVDDKFVTVGSEWSKGGIRLRKSFTLDKLPERVTLRVFCRSSCNVYLNGKPIKRFIGRYRNDRIHGQDVPLRPETVKLLRKGANVLGVQCNDYSGTKFVDVGLIEVVD